MSRLLSRTSITIDEAVSILLGRSKGPIELTPINSMDDQECGDFSYCLQEDLEDELDMIVSEYAEAKYDKQPEHDIAEKSAALQHQKTVIPQANAYLCAIHDELNKGEQSMLKVDKGLSNAVYTFITLHSFNEWAKRMGNGVFADLSAIVSKPSASEPTPVPRQRTRMKEQEAAILAEIVRQGYDPQAFPKNPSGGPGAKAAIRESLKSGPLFKGNTTFDKAWERLSKDKSLRLSNDPPPHK